jgi:predicted PurR-regulated permease PerM
MIVGIILAMFLNVPTNSIERRLTSIFSKKKKQPSQKALHLASFLVSVVLILLVIALVVTLVIPELVNSIKELFSLLGVRIPQWVEYLNTQNIDVNWLEELLLNIDLREFSQKVTDGIGSVLNSVFGAVSSILSVTLTICFGAVIAIYIVLDKNAICKHIKRITYAYLKPSWADSLSNFAKGFSISFSKFLTGQCTEAVLLGGLIFISFSIFGIPYAALAGVLTAFCAIIPYVGAFLSGVVSVFLTLVVDPTLAVRCLVIYLVIQFIETQFIYPRVVGGSMGLSPLYTLVAALIGGELFGILGMIFFIPLSAVVIEVIKADTQKRLSVRNISIE